MHPVSQGDFEKLQGTWSQTRLEADGVGDPPNDQHSAPGVVCMIEGNGFRVVKPDNTVLLQGNFELDATVSPKAITWIDSIGEDAGKALPAIYELTDKTFRFIAADEGQPRPTEFKTIIGLTMRAFIRIE